MNLTSRTTSSAIDGLTDLVISRLVRAEELYYDGGAEHDYTTMTNELENLKLHCLMSGHHQAQNLATLLEANIARLEQELSELCLAQAIVLHYASGGFPAMP